MIKWKARRGFKNVWFLGFGSCAGCLSFQLKPVVVVAFCMQLLKPACMKEGLKDMNWTNQSFLYVPCLLSLVACMSSHVTPNLSPSLWELYRVPFPPLFPTKYVLLQTAAIYYCCSCWVCCRCAMPEREKWANELSRKGMFVCAMCAYRSSRHAACPHYMALAPAILRKIHHKKSAYNANQIERRTGCVLCKKATSRTTMAMTYVALFLSLSHLQKRLRYMRLVHT